MKGVAGGIIYAGLDKILKKSFKFSIKGALECVWQRAKMTCRRLLRYLNGDVLMNLKVIEGL